MSVYEAISFAINMLSSNSKGVYIHINMCLYLTLTMTVILITVLGIYLVIEEQLPKDSSRYRDRRISIDSKSSLHNSCCSLLPHLQA